MLHMAPLRRHRLVMALGCISLKDPEDTATVLVLGLVRWVGQRSPVHRKADMVVGTPHKISMGNQEVSTVSMAARPFLRLVQVQDQGLGRLDQVDQLLFLLLLVSASRLASLG